MRIELINTVVGDLMSKNVNFCFLLASRDAFRAYGVDQEERAFLRSAALAACQAKNNPTVFAQYIEAKLPKD